jgi:hypothetical protein
MMVGVVGGRSRGVVVCVVGWACVARVSLGWDGSVPTADRLWELVR